VGIRRLELYKRQLQEEDPVKWACQRMRKGARVRSSMKELPFDLSVAHVLEIAPTHCPVLGVELIYSGDGGRGNPHTCSLDRIEPEKGYVKGNVQVISQLANMMKSSATTSQLVMFAGWIQETYCVE